MILMNQPRFDDLKFILGDGPLIFQVRKRLQLGDQVRPLFRSAWKLDRRFSAILSVRKGRIRVSLAAVSQRQQPVENGNLNWLPPTRPLPCLLVGCKAVLPDLSKCASHKLCQAEQGKEQDQPSPDQDGMSEIRDPFDENHHKGPEKGDREKREDDQVKESDI